MTQTDRLLKELVTEFKKFNANFSEFADAKTAITLLGRSNPREMKYIREHFLLDPGDYKMKNGCTFEYCVKSLVQLKSKIDSGRVVFPFSKKVA